jgi:hypothetical protein
MQARLLIVGTILAFAAGASSSHASGFSTRPADKDLALSSVPLSRSCTDTVAERLALLQEPSTLTATHRSGLAVSR